MSEQNGLPEGWKWARLGDVASSGQKRSPKADGEGEFLYVDVEALDNSTQRIVAPKRLRNSEAPSRARLEIESGDVLFSLVRPYLKNVAKVPEELNGQIASTAYCLVRPALGVHSSFLFHFLTQESFINSLPTYGNSPPAARDEEFYDMLIPVPPTDEQRRIVEAIEEQLSRLDAGVAGLERARTTLKRYRTAVLKAAVEGRLTEAWREENPDVESASELLDRILKERRERWEKDQLATYEKKGKIPPKNWQSKYREPAGPNTEDLPELPEGWCWVSVEQLLIHPMINGISVKGSDDPPGVPALRLSAMSDRGFDYTDHRYIPIDDKVAESLAVRAGDFFVSRGNGSLHLVGRGTLAQAPAERIVFPDTIIRLRLGETPHLRSFLSVAWASRILRTQIEKAARTTAGIYKISQRDIGSFAIPLPPLAEQEQIVAEVERRLSILQEVEAEVEANLKRAARLRQAILKQAFEGKLVPQDPTDEPASELLARIRADHERSAAPKRRRGKRPAQGNTSAPQPSLFPGTNT